MTLHTEPHPLAGKTVKLAAHVEDARGQLTPGGLFRVEDYWDRAAGRSWTVAAGNPAAMRYAVRTGGASYFTPLDDEVLYGKVDGFGHLVHVSEIEAPE